MKTKYPQVSSSDIGMGAISAFLAAMLFRQLETGEENASVNLWRLLVAFIGATLVLSLIRLTTGRHVFTDKSQENQEASAEV